MKKLSTSVAAIFAFTALSGCDSLIDQEAAQALFEEVLSLGEEDVTPEENLPGSASYEGFAIVGNDGETDERYYFGALGLDVNFDTASYTGTMDNFGKVTNVDELDEKDSVGSISKAELEAVDGEFDLDGEVISGEGTAFLSGEADGSVDGTSDTIETMGFILGENGEYILMYGEGDEFFMEGVAKQ